MSTTSIRSFGNSPRNSLRTRSAALASAVVFALAFIATPAAWAQTFTVLHTFVGGADGAHPMAGLTIDAARDLYGTASQAGMLNGDCKTHSGCGTVFRLKHSGSGWVLTPIYAFAGGDDGFYPQGRVAIAQDGTLCGTTGGCEGSCTLTPSNGGWTYTSLYDFTGDGDGRNPISNLVFDTNGNLYGTTYSGGIGYGVVFEITP